MIHKKAYFLDNETCFLYELSPREKKRLEKKHPKWVSYDCEKNKADLDEVFNFFKTNGKVLAFPYLQNIFVGLTA
jgi:hypothetical protein